MLMLWDTQANTSCAVEYIQGVCSLLVTADQMVVVMNIFIWLNKPKNYVPTTVIGSYLFVTALRQQPRDPHCRTTAPPDEKITWAT